MKIRGIEMKTEIFQDSDIENILSWFYAWYYMRKEEDVEKVPESVKSTLQKLSFYCYHKKNELA